MTWGSITRHVIAPIYPTGTGDYTLSLEVPYGFEFLVLSAEGRNHSAYWGSADFHILTAEDVVLQVSRGWIIGPNFYFNWSGEVEAKGGDKVGIKFFNANATWQLSAKFTYKSRRV